MSKKIQLQIPKPCHEDWDNMTPVEKGRFCSSCQKQVVDFSRMSDREVAMFFKKPSAGSVCGRFMTDQLDRDLEIPRKRIPWVKYFFQFLLPGFLISMKASAQKGEISVKKKTECSKPVTSKKQKNPEENIFGSFVDGNVNIVTVPTNVSHRSIIKGKILDEAGQPIPHTTVIIKDSKICAMSDELGNYVIEPVHGWKEVTLIFRSNGHEPVQLIVQREFNSGNADIILSGEKFWVGQLFIRTVIQEKKIAISGRISNENNQSIPFATITIDDVITIADSLGNYKAKISTTNPGIQIKASSAGYFSKEIHKEATQSTIHQDLTLKADDVLKEVVVVSYPTKGKVAVTTIAEPIVKSTEINTQSCSIIMGYVGIKRKVDEINKDLPKIIPSNEMKLYPNPIQAHSTLHIAWDQKETGDFDMQFFNAAGQLVFKKQLYIDEDARVLSVDLPSLVAGNYFVKMINRSTSKSYTAKIIVQ
jgi:type IX secretion system substrate protein